MSDVFIAALFVWLFVAGGYGWQGLLFDGDIGWHIRTGQYILSHRAVPTADLFSFTRPGAEWFAWEWMSDVLFALVHNFAGLQGVVLAAAAVLTLWAFLLLRQALWRGANGWVAMAVTLLGVSASTIHFLARPHILTLLFATLAVWIIESDRRAAQWRVWLLVPFTALWTNLHGGFVVVVALVALAAVGSAGEAVAGLRGWQGVWRYTGLTASCCAASLLNPYGYRLHIHIAGFLRSSWIRDAVQEFQAPTFRSENQLQYEILLLAGVALSTFLFARRRYVEALWILAFGHLSLSSVRNAPVYIAVAAPILAGVLTELWSAAASRSSRGSVSRILHDTGLEMTPGFQRTSVWLGVLLAAILFAVPAASWPRDFPPALFPISLVHSNESMLATGRVLTVDQWADYLIYAHYPRQRVFVDGRSDFFGPELGAEYLQAVQGDYRWRATLDRYAVDTVLAPVSWPLATLLKSGPGWRIVGDDGHAILFSRGIDAQK